jgi:phospholipid/cholesterol/gamma-HCH transport system permease protein
MARSQLGIGFREFADRFGQADAGRDAADRHRQVAGVRRHHRGGRLLPGLSHPGGADSVGRQTTLSVVQSIFLVIVADALFSVAFSVLDL